MIIKLFASAINGSPKIFTLPLWDDGLAWFASKWW